MKPSLDPRDIVDGLLRTTGLLIRRVRAEHPHELTMSQAQAMSRLANDGPMTTADLARAEAMKPQSMGATLAALEQEGLVAREPHPTDGRQILFRLTRQGEDFRHANKDASRSWLLGAIGGLSAAEQKNLAAAIDVLWKIAQQ